MDWLWTWSGLCFGYKDGSDLWTYDGKHIGTIVDDEITASDGSYLGEVRNDRLITMKSKKNMTTGFSFTPSSNRASIVKRADYFGSTMLAGYEDFPESESF